MLLRELEGGLEEVHKQARGAIQSRDRLRSGDALETAVTQELALRALDVDNGSEFVNDSLIQYCLSHGIELTRSRPYRKNDQAWIEQKNGAVVRCWRAARATPSPMGKTGARGSSRCMAFETMRPALRAS